MEDKDFIIEDDPLLGRDVLIECSNREIVEAIIPEGVTAIGEAAFEGCSTLKHVHIPSSVTFIGDDAFRDCFSLVLLEIPSSVIGIGATPFYLCDSLTSIEVDKNNEKYASIDGVLYNKELTVLLCCPAKKKGDFIVSNNVEEIGPYAFKDCSLTSITLPETITEIPDGAFSNCVYIKEFVIPNSVASLGMDSFSSCTSLVSIIIPRSVTFIDEYAFDNCTSLEVITYSGTKEEWAAIEKVAEWDIDSSISIIRCSDGDIHL